MSSPVKRAVVTVVAAMLISAFSTFFGVTLARAIRQHRSSAAEVGPEE